jgi:xanthine dehydrogenase iron-sulfur cluster and FAD-binding subunit A
MYSFYAAPTTLAEALALKAQHGLFARIIAGGTDLLIELDRSVRKAPDGNAPGVIDITHIPGLAEIEEVDGWIQLGPLVTHNQCVASPLMVAKAFPLARACWEVGAPQIRNRATVAGNLITASPANDTIVPLLALDAQITVQSAQRGVRTLPLSQFLTGFRKVDLADDELLTRITFPALSDQVQGTFIKLGLRRAQAISVLSVAVIIETDGDPAHSPIRQARISLGAVAPVIVRAPVAEAYLLGKVLSDEVIREASQRALAAASPIDDIRSSADYRLGMVETLVGRALRQLRNGQARAGWSEQPILLWGQSNGKWPATASLPTQPDALSLPATVNHQPVHLPGGMTLLDSLRAAGFVGVKEGCAEGECGACTIFLDGMAVMACLVPAERAAGSTVVTVEGLANGEQLHPVQAAFVQSGGVQCGYCTPGFVMSAAKLFEERPHPTREEAQQALTGNLCRCTGYRKILDAVVMAGEVSPSTA